MVWPVTRDWRQPLSRLRGPAQGEESNVSAQEAARTQGGGTRDERTPERVPLESPTPHESPPRSDVDSSYASRVLPLGFFAMVIGLYAAIGYGLYLLLGSLL